MEIGTLIGLGLAIVGVFVGMVMEGGDPMFLLTKPAALMIVVVSAVGATITSFRFSDTLGSLKALMKVLMPGPPPDLAGTVEQFAQLADVARREGLLQLESRLGAIEDPFMRRGLQMAVDGTDSEVVRETLEAELAEMKARHKVAAKWFTQAGIYAPTFGIIGAVLGLIHTLEGLEDPSGIGEGIAAAFVATFWGVFSANAIFLPFGAKLERLSNQEAAYRTLVIEGVAAIQNGHTSRAVAEILSGMLPPAERPSEG